MYRQLAIVNGRDVLTRPKKKLARVADESDMIRGEGAVREVYDLAWDANGRRRHGRRRGGRRRLRLRRLLGRLVKIPVTLLAYLLRMFRRPTLELIEAGDEMRNRRVRIWFTPDPAADPMNYMMMQSSLGVAWIF